MPDYLKDLTGVVQAGGRSRRMGQDKALMDFLGEPLILQPIRILEQLTREILVITNQPQDYAFLNKPLVKDALPDRGALGGLYTALLAARTAFTATVACDMPFVSERLLRAQYRALCESPDAAAAIPESSHGLEPLHAVYRTEICLPAVKSALEGGKRRMVSWHQGLIVNIIPNAQVREHDREELAFLNLNTVEEFRTAEGIARERPAGRN
ncbi:MAG: molybdenum cofactor guanylyltransferase [Anaerolineales bacterium]|nr:molybdenum cofactor guanylyltransferase [Anaerolineales bacterium]